MPTVVWNGLPLTFNSPIVYDPGRIFVPLNDVVNGIGAVRTDVGGRARITLEGKAVTLPIRLENGVEYVAARDLFEGLGRNVTWYPWSRCASIGWLK